MTLGAYVSTGSFSVVPAGEAPHHPFCFAFLSPSQWGVKALHACLQLSLTSERQAGNGGEVCQPQAELSVRLFLCETGQHQSKAEH